MNAINPYLTFDGQTRDAMTFYSECLEGELTIRSFGEFGKAAPGTEDRVMHASITKGGSQVLMASDSQPGQPVTMGDNVWLSVDCSDNAEQDKMFEAFSRGGHVIMPLAVQFWGARFGMVKDKFGLGWMFNCEQQK